MSFDFEMKDVTAFEHDDDRGTVRVILANGDTKIVNQVEFMNARDNDFERFDRARPGEYTVALCADDNLKPFLRRSPILSWGVRRHDGFKIPITTAGPDHYACVFQRANGTIVVERGSIFPNGDAYLGWNPPEDPKLQEIVEVTGFISLVNPRGPVITDEKTEKVWRLDRFRKPSFDMTGPGFTVRGRRGDYDLISDWEIVAP